MRRPATELGVAGHREQRVGVASKNFEKFDTHFSPHLGRPRFRLLPYQMTCGEAAPILDGVTSFLLSGAAEDGLCLRVLEDDFAQ
jgi:hypothetical protein